MGDTTRYWQWEGICQELQNVRLAQAKLSNHDDIVSHRLSEGYRSALQSLDMLLLDQIRHKSQDIAKPIPLRSGFKKAWDIKATELSRSIVGRMIRTNATKVEDGFATPELYDKDVLDFCISALVYDPNLSDEPNTRLLQKDAALVFTILEEYLEECYRTKNKDELVRLDDILYKHIDELCAMHKMLAIVRLHRPYLGRSTCIIIQDFKLPKDSKLWRYMRKGFFNRNLPDLSRPNQSPASGDHVHTPWIREDGKCKYEGEKKLADLLRCFLETPRPTGSRYTQE
jgi:hypothetical protein